MSRRSVVTVVNQTFRPECISWKTDVGSPREIVRLHFYSTLGGCGLSVNSEVFIKANHGMAPAKLAATVNSADEEINRAQCPVGRTTLKRRT